MIKTKNNKKYVNFNELKTGNAITRQWNNIKYKAGKNQVTLSELEYIIANTTNEAVLSDVINNYYNKAVKRHNKATGDTKKWYTKAERTKKGIREIAAENRETKNKDNMDKQKKVLNYVVDKIGYGNHLQREMWVEVGGIKVPNPKLIGVEFSDLAQEMLEIGVDNGEDLKTITDKIKIKEQEHKEYIELVKKANKSMVEEIEEATTERLKNFILEHSDPSTQSGIHHGYFGYTIGKDIEKAKLQALLGKLNAGEKLAVENILLDAQFLQMWGSDQDTPTYDAEFRENRLDEIIAIIERYIGQGTQYNATTKSIEFYPLKSQPTITTGIRLEDFIGR